MDLPTELLYQIVDLLVDPSRVKSCQQIYSLSAANHALYEALGTRLFYYAMTHWKAKYLYWAAKRDYVDCLRKVLDTTLGPEIQKDNLDLAINYAAKWGRNSTIEFLLSRYPDILDAQTRLMGSPLCEAVENRHMSTVNLLMSRNASLESANRARPTPLHTAARKGFPEMLELLIRAGADIHAVYNNESALYVASIWDNFDEAKMLLDHGATRDLRPDRNLVENPLLVQMTESHRRSDILGLLLQYGADADCWDSSWGTPLMRAVRLGEFERAEALLDHGADPSLVNPQGQAVLSIAMLGMFKRPDLLEKEDYSKEYSLGEGRLPVINLINRLVDNGAKINDDGRCSLSLHLAVRNHFRTFAKRLLAAGAVPDSVRGNPRSFLDDPPTLWWAVTRRDIELTRLILANGADPDVELTWHTCNRDMPRRLIEVTLRRGMFDFVELLLEHGATPTKKCLPAVVREERLDLAQKMILKGAKPSGDELFMAIAKGNEAMVSLLLENGADSNCNTPKPTGKRRREKGAETRTQSSLLEYAMRKGNATIVDILRKHVAKEPA